MTLVIRMLAVVSGEGVFDDLVVGLVKHLLLNLTIYNLYLLLNK